MGILVNVGLVRGMMGERGQWLRAGKSMLGERERERERGGVGGGGGRDKSRERGGREGRGREGHGECRFYSRLSCWGHISWR